MYSSIDIDKLFILALLEGSPELQSIVKGRVYDPGRSADAEREDLIPYIVVNIGGGSNQKNHKECTGEGDSDIVDVNLLLVAEGRAQLGEIFRHTRKVLRLYLEESEDVLDYGVSFSNVQMDISKPCVFVSLKYSVEVQLN